MKYWPSTYEGVTTHFFEVDGRICDGSGWPSPEFQAWLAETGYHKEFTVYSLPLPPTLGTDNEEAAFAFRMRFC